MCCASVIHYLGCGQTIKTPLYCHGRSPAELPPCSEWKAKEFLQALSDVCPYCKQDLILAPRSPSPRSRETEDMAEELLHIRRGSLADRYRPTPPPPSIPAIGDGTVEDEASRRTNGRISEWLDDVDMHRSPVRTRPSTRIEQENLVSTHGARGTGGSQPEMDRTCRPGVFVGSHSIFAARTEEVSRIQRESRNSPEIDVSRHPPHSVAVYRPHTPPRVEASEYRRTTYGRYSSTTSERYDPRPNSQEAAVYMSRLSVNSQSASRMERASYRTERRQYHNEVFRTDTLRSSRNNNVSEREIGPFERHVDPLQRSVTRQSIDSASQRPERTEVVRRTRYRWIEPSEADETGHLRLIGEDVIRVSNVTGSAEASSRRRRRHSEHSSGYQSPDSRSARWSERR